MHVVFTCFFPIFTNPYAPDTCDPMIFDPENWMGRGPNLQDLPLQTLRIFRWSPELNTRETIW